MEAPQPKVENQLLRSGMHIQYHDESDFYKLLETRHLLNDICKKAKRLSVLYNNQNFTHYIRLDRECGLTCCVRDGKPQVGLYSVADNSITQNVTLRSLRYLNENIVLQMESRLKNAAMHDLEIHPLEKAWEELFMQNEKSNEKLTIGAVSQLQNGELEEDEYER